MDCEEFGTSFFFVRSFVVHPFRAFSIYYITRTYQVPDCAKLTWSGRTAFSRRRKAVQNPISFAVSKPGGRFEKPFTLSTHSAAMDDAMQWINNGPLPPSMNNAETLRKNIYITCGTRVLENAKIVRPFVPKNVWTGGAASRKCRRKVSQKFGAINSAELKFQIKMI